MTNKLLCYYLYDGFQMLENVMSLYEYLPLPIFTNNKNVYKYLKSINYDVRFYNNIEDINYKYAISTHYTSSVKYFEKMFYIGHGISEKEYYKGNIPYLHPNSWKDSPAIEKDKNLLFNRYIKGTIENHDVNIDGFILYAPTIMPFCSFLNNNFTIIDDLYELSKKYKIVIKPHSMHYRLPEYKKIFNLNMNNCIILPETKYNILKYMEKCSLFIGDVSSVSCAYTYFRRGFIYLETRINNNIDYSFKHLLCNSPEATTIRNGSILKYVNNITYSDSQYFEYWYGDRDKLINAKQYVEEILEYFL